MRYLLLLLAAIGIFAFMTPYLALQRLVDGMENEDVAVVDKYVDFDQVRASFQKDFVTGMGLEAGTTDSIGNTLATRIAGAFISTIVSPESMVSVLKDKDRRDRLGLSPDLMTLMGRGKWVNDHQFILRDEFDKPTMLLERTGMKWEVTAVSLK